VPVLCRCFIFRASGDVHPATNRPRPAAGEPPPAMTARSQAQTGRAVILIVGAAMDAGHHGPPDDAIATGFSAPRRHFRYDASSAVPAARTWFFVTTTPLASSSVEPLNSSSSFVGDTGIGMTAEQQAKLFEEFSQQETHYAIGTKSASLPDHAFVGRCRRAGGISSERQSKGLRLQSRSRPARGPVDPRKASSGFRRGTLICRTRLPTRESRPSSAALDAAPLDCA
jgi:hypothetical protein